MARENCELEIMQRLFSSNRVCKASIFTTLIPAVGNLRQKASKFRFFLYVTVVRLPAKLKFTTVNKQAMFTGRISFLARFISAGNWLKSAGKRAHFKQIITELTSCMFSNALFNKFQWLSAAKPELYVYISELL